MFFDVELGVMSNCSRRFSEGREICVWCKFGLGCTDLLIVAKADTVTQESDLNTIGIAYVYMFSQDISTNMNIFRIPVLNASNRIWNVSSWTGADQGADPRIEKQLGLEDKENWITAEELQQPLGAELGWLENHQKVGLDGIVRNSCGKWTMNGICLMDKYNQIYIYILFI